MSSIRNKTRFQRYQEKKKTAKKLPISLCAINFKHEGNIGFLIRSAACFGAEKVSIIGNIPDRKIVNPLSGSLMDFIKINTFKNPSSFLEYSRKNDYELISAEINKNSENIHNFHFSFQKHICILVGHEELGVPVEIIQNSKCLSIPMPGIGFCLNTSQTANIMLYEAVKQYEAYTQKS